MLARYDRNGQKYTFTQNSSNKTMLNPNSPSVLMGHQVATVPRLGFFGHLQLGQVEHGNT